jgi:hypothetical protein
MTIPRRLPGGGGKDGRFERLTTLPPSRADFLEIWDPQTPGNLTACTGMIMPRCTRGGSSVAAIPVYKVKHFTFCTPDMAIHNSSDSEEKLAAIRSRFCCPKTSDLASEKMTRDE